MTKLLVSVRSVAEARSALEGGADIVDIKEPRRGPLGRADDEVISSIIDFVAGRVAVSVALGELSEQAPAPRGLDFAKAGLADETNWAERWHLWRESLSCGAVLVAYVDRPNGKEIVREAQRLKPRMLLLDTATKEGRGLLHYFSLDEIREIINLSNVALAGSLDQQTIRTIVPLKPDIIAVRAAACDGGRDGTVSALRVRRLADLIHLAPVGPAG